MSSAELQDTANPNYPMAVLDWTNTKFAVLCGRQFPDNDLELCYYLMSCNAGKCSKLEDSQLFSLITANSGAQSSKNAPRFGRLVEQRDGRTAHCAIHSR